MKTLLNITPAQIMEGGDANVPELMVSIVPAASHSNPIKLVSHRAGISAPGAGFTIGMGSALVSCIWFKDGKPYLDFVDTAQINSDGTITPGIDLGTDPVVVLWYHIPGDDDALAGWWM